MISDLKHKNLIFLEVDSRSGAYMNLDFKFWLCSTTGMSITTTHTRSPFNGLVGMKQDFTLIKKLFQILIRIQTTILQDLDKNFCWVPVGGVSLLFLSSTNSNYISKQN